METGGTTGRREAGLALDAGKVQPRDLISAFAKGLAVIQAFSDKAPELTLTAVAQRAGITRASARRLLLTLVDQGFAERVDDRLFSLTPKVLLLGNAYLSSMPMWRFAEPVLEELVGDIGETCSLSVLDGNEVVYVLRIPVRRVMDRVSTVGTHLPAYCTSMGRLLLAWLPEARLERYFTEVTLEPHTAATIVSRRGLESALREVRQLGYAWVSGEMEADIKGLAVPVCDSRGNAIAALAVSVNRTGVERAAFVRRTLPGLKRAAARLSSSMLVCRNGAAPQPQRPAGRGSQPRKTKSDVHE